MAPLVWVAQPLRRSTVVRLGRCSVVEVGFGSNALVVENDVEK